MSFKNVDKVMGIFDSLRHAHEGDRGANHDDKSAGKP